MSKYLQSMNVLVYYLVVTMSSVWAVYATGEIIVINPSKTSDNVQYAEWRQLISYHLVEWWQTQSVNKHCKIILRYAESCYFKSNPRESHTYSLAKFVIDSVSPFWSRKVSHTCNKEERLSNTFTRGECPFGTSCFYKHQYPDGSLDVRQVRTAVDADGHYDVLRQVRLDHFLSSQLP